VSRVLAAAVQMTSTADVERNLATSERLVREAASRGATLVGLPENFGHLRSEGEPVPAAQTMDGPWVSRLSALARELNITLLLGSLPEKGDEGDDDGRVFNTSVLLGPTGKVLAKYRKIHLFDIDIPGMAHLKESRAVRPGGELAVADTPAGRIGLSICYDLRFPELYRRLGLRKPQILAVPSAFTGRTGRDHWEILVRARAIENLCYVLAPAQVGDHGAGRRSWGHAAIVDPWGTVVAEVPEGEGFAMAPLDFELQERLRRELPALSHIRLQ
jgi:deaminated glutathione amidase